VKLGKPKAADYDAAKGALPAMRFSFEEPSSHGALLRQLGTPAGWSDDQAPAETLGPLVRAAAALARKLALAEPTEPPPADVPRTRPRSPSSRARRPRGKS
jgi:hypothetical protein